MTRIAIVTGATGGIGEKFVREISKMDVDEIWAVGRNKSKLDSLKNEITKVVPVEADLGADGVSVIAEKINVEKPDIIMLVNNAGVAYMGRFEKMGLSEVEKFCKINCSAPTELMTVALPYMHEGAKILNIASASSFQPNPYLSMYSATKVYLKNFSRAVNVELKKRGITVTCVCPGWVDTGMLPRTRDGKEIKYTGMISADKVVAKALKDSRRGKEMSVPGFFSNYFRIYSKITPTKITMKWWVFAIRKYV